MAVHSNPALDSSLELVVIKMFNFLKPKIPTANESRELEDFAIYMDLFENPNEQEQTKTLVKHGLTELHGEGDKDIPIPKETKHPRCAVCNMFARHEQQPDGKYYCKPHTPAVDK